MTLARAAVLLALAAPAAIPLAAQTPIAPGQTVAGTLDESDPRSDQGVHYDTYVIRGRPGDRVVVQMSSPHFDAYLRWGLETEGGDWMEHAANDDGGDGTDARLVVTLGGPGELELRATGYSEGELGEYELRVTAAAPLARTRIRVGETVRGELNDSDAPGERGVEDHFILRGEPGSTFTAHLESGDFDPYLLFGAWEDGELLPITADDDGGEGIDARLVGEFGEASEYSLVVRSFFGEGRGTYTLRLEAGGTPGVDESIYADTGYVTTTDTVVALSSDPAGDWGADTVMMYDSAIVLPPGYEDMEIVAEDTWMEGTLDDGSDRDERGIAYRDYAWYAREGESLVIEVLSDEFDPLVSIGLGRGERHHVLEENDDGGDGQNARAEFVAPQEGLYVVRVYGTAPDQRGGYALRIRR
jgi:hypothetical protein